MSNIARYIGWPLITSGSILNLQGNNSRNGTCINIYKYRPQAEFDVHVNIVLIVFYWKYKSQVISAKPKVVVNKSQQRSDLFFFPILFRWFSWHGDRWRYRIRCGRIGWSYWFGRVQRCKVLIWSSREAYFDSFPLQKRDLMISYNHIIT